MSKLSAEVSARHANLLELLKSRDTFFYIFRLWDYVGTYAVNGSVWSDENETHDLVYKENRGVGEIKLHMDQTASYSRILLLSLGTKFTMPVDDIKNSKMSSHWDLTQDEWNVIREAANNEPLWISDNILWAKDFLAKVKDAQQANKKSVSRQPVSRGGGPVAAKRSSAKSAAKNTAKSSAKAHLGMNNKG
jgi:hypothetical protein